jgi:hypothetical protein
MYLIICEPYYPKVSKKIVKTLLIEDFFHLPQVVHLELRIISRILEKKSRNVLNIAISSPGENDS